MMWEGCENNNVGKIEEETPETVVVDVDIPMIKSEPMSPARSNSYETLQEGIMVSHLPIVTPCKMKEPIILLERCDKIWETLKLIKNIQNDNSENTVNPTKIIGTVNSSLLSSENNPKPSYIRYQPVIFDNNNSAPPNFQLSVKSTKKLFHCTVCGKEYSENRSLRAHSQKIHGIFIPPKRRPKFSINVNNKIDTKSESRDGKSHVNNTKTAPLNEFKEGSNEDVTLNNMMQSINIKTNKNNFQIEAKNNTLDNTATHTINKYRGKCPLCKRIVTLLYKHLTEYHKINCPHLIIKELESTVKSQTEITLKDFTKALVTTRSLSELSQNENVKTSKQMDENALQNFENNNQKYEVIYSRSHKRPKLDTNNALNVTNQNSLTVRSAKGKTYTCEICFGIYANYSSFYKHKQAHRKRGETTDNFNIIQCHYANSPLNNKRNNSSTCITPDNSSVIIASNAKDIEEVKRVSINSMEMENSQDYETNIPDEMNLEKTCICGKSFHDYHTLILHKRTCKFKSNNETVSFMENSDRDSGNGINITIKKKNDSYEIVNRESSDENKSKDLGVVNNYDSSPDISDFTSDNDNEILHSKQSSNICEYSNYSKHHSVMKIESIDENIDIDIEEDSQNNLFHENGDYNQIHENNESVKEIPTIAHLCETIFTEQSKIEDTSVLLKTKEKRSNNVRNSDSVKSRKKHLIGTLSTSGFIKVKTKKLAKSINKNSFSNMSMHVNTNCPCGESFKTLKCCNMHIASCHPLFLRCGYCKERFNTISEYNNHKCTVERGKKFNKTHEDLFCPFCSIVIKNKSGFYQHINSEHFHPELPYQCYECVEKFASSSQLHTHSKKLHSQTMCNVCGVKLRSIIKLKHEGYHYGLGFPCHICKRTHATYQSLAKHYQMVHEEENKTLVTCNVCFKTVKQKSLGWHLYSHKAMVTCELCRRTFCDGRTLEHHIIMRHQGKYPWIKCNFCKRRFCSKKLLDNHIKRDKCNVDINKMSKQNSLLHS